MSNSFLRRRWKLLLNIATLVALAILIAAIRHQLVDTLHNLFRVNVWLLLLIIPIEALNYHTQTRLYQRLFILVDEKMPYKGLLRLSIELNFINHVFPSGGVSGLSYFSYRMRQFGVRGTKATLIQTVKLLMLFVSFEILLFFGMFALAINNKASNLTIFMGGSLTLSVLFGTGIFLYVIGSRSRINAFISGLTRSANWLIRIVRPKHPDAINVSHVLDALEQFHEDYMQLQSRFSDMRPALWWALVANLTEVLVVYVVYLSFGSYVNIGAVILAYAVANFAGLVSVLPGGIGIYEALMTAALITSGVPARISLPVTVMYRVLNTLLQLPPGYFLYHESLQQKSTTTLSEAGHGERG